MASVLVVEDNFDTRTLLTVFLEMAGYRVRQADDGQEGLESVAHNRPDLVLLDVEMPVLSGPEMANGLLLRDCGDEDIPVVLLSGVVGLRDIAVKVGTPYFLAKPYEPEALIQMVERALEERIPPRPKAGPLRSGFPC